MAADVMIYLLTAALAAILAVSTLTFWKVLAMSALDDLVAKLTLDLSDLKTAMVAKDATIADLTAQVAALQAKVPSDATIAALTQDEADAAALAHPPVAPPANP